MSREVGGKRFADCTSPHSEGGGLGRGKEVESLGPGAIEFRLEFRFVDRHCCLLLGQTHLVIFSCSAIDLRLDLSKNFNLRGRGET